MNRRSFLQILGIAAVTPQFLYPTKNFLQEVKEHHREFGVPPHDIARTVHMYQSDFGMVNVVMDRWQPSGVTEDDINAHLEKAWERGESPNIIYLSPSDVHRLTPSPGFGPGGHP